MSDQNTVSWETYDKGKPGGGGLKPFPSKGVYTFQVPTILGAEIFESKEDGSLTALLDPLVMVGGEHAGYQMRFNRVTNKRYSNRNACSMGDLLLAANSPFRPQTDEQWKQAVLSIAGAVIQIGCDWEAYDKINKVELAKSEDQFPMVNGVRQRFFEVPDPSAPQGKRRVWANLKAKYYKAVE